LTKPIPILNWPGQLFVRTLWAIRFPLIRQPVTISISVHLRPRRSAQRASVMRGSGVWRDPELSPSVRGWRRQWPSTKICGCASKSRSPICSTTPTMRLRRRMSVTLLHSESCNPNKLQKTPVIARARWHSASISDSDRRPELGSSSRT
jgi:hypothetical protein